MGGLTGVTTGLTGTFVVPGVLYLQRMELNRSKMHLCRQWGYLAVWQQRAKLLGISLGGRGVLSNELLFISSCMVIPALLGMVLGNIVRSKIDEGLFRKLFFFSLSAIGMGIVISAVSNLN